MNKYKIQQWKDIENDFSDKLLLGNGASRAIWDGFKYDSLYEVANKTGKIDDNLKNLFSDLGTRDFEYILRVLSQTQRINNILKIEDGKTGSLYKKLKTALIGSIHEVHPSHDQVKNKLITMAIFMKRFNIILSLNYDLLVYWAMLDGNDKFGKWFKDCFVDDYRFDNDYHYLEEPYGGTGGATLVFYPHGNLILATEFLGNEIKLTKFGDTFLLDDILKTWENGEYIPLFVSEGGTKEKFQAITRSNYLKTVYDYEIDSRETESLVVYGWSFRDEDEHILKGIVKSVKRMAVSVHVGSGNEQSFCRDVDYKIDKMYTNLGKKRTLLLHFFNSESEGCWVSK